MKKTGILPVLLFSALVVKYLPVIPINLSSMKKFKFLGSVALTAIGIILPFYCSGKEKQADSQKEVVRIDVINALKKYPVANLSDYFTTVEYIPLETNKNSLLGDIRKIFFEKNMFYVLDNNYHCRIFDRSGRYISTFNRRGNGPEEYAQISDINIDPLSGNILILDRNTIKEYDPSGNFIKKIEKPDKTFNFVKFSILSNGLIAANIIDLKSGSKEEGFLIYDSSLKVYGKTIFSSPIPNPGPPAQDGSIRFTPVVTDFYVFSRYKSQFIVSRKFIDTVYQINTDYTMSPAYVFDFGEFSFEKQNIPPSEIDNNSPVITKSPYIFQNSGYLFLNFDMRGKAPFSYTGKARNGMTQIVNTDVKGIYDKKKRVLTLLDEPSRHMGGLKDDIREGPPFWPLFVSSENTMIACYNAMDLIQLQKERGREFKGLEKITNGLGEEDNPVIVFVK